MNQEAFERLVKICGLLASDQDGERASAAMLATKILKEHKLAWSDVVTNPKITHKMREAPKSQWAPPPGNWPPPTPPIGYAALDVVVKRATERAWLVRTTAMREGWVPKSQCELYTFGSASVLHCPMWIADRAGFVY